MRTENPILLTREETGRIVRRISPQFAQYVQKFDEQKYPPREYQALLSAFATPRNVAAYIRRALVWKWGHTGKQRIPAHHDDLIGEIEKIWSGLDFSGSANDVFGRISDKLKSRSRYITAAFLLHLVRPNECPIIDQHNFRAMNHLLGEVRPGWSFDRSPSKFSDIVMLHSFMKQLTKNWRGIVSTPRPSSRELDIFLMMCGKELKVRKPRRKRKAKSGSDRATVTSDPIGDLDNGGTDALIRLPFGGADASFAVSALIAHLQESNRDFIIQGQTNCSYAEHPKQSSLDYWLRKNFAKNRDTRQAVKEVIESLVDTEFFDLGEYKCPDSGRQCVGIQLAKPRVLVAGRAS